MFQADTKKEANVIEFSYLYNLPVKIYFLNKDVSTQLFKGISYKKNRKE